MKKALLAIATLLITGSTQAQNLAPDYHFEVGLYGGISLFTTPNHSFDKGVDNVQPAIWSANVNYNLTDHWQFGLDASVSRWRATGPQLLHGLSDSLLGTVNTDYIYADRVWTLMARASSVIPHYDQYRLNRSNFYYGIAVGVVFTINDGSNGYDQFMSSKGEQYRYVSRIDYESMAGYAFGVHVGWNYYFTNHFGINTELAPRYTHLSGIDPRAGGRNGMFDTWSFPLTLGLRMRF